MHCVCVCVCECETKNNTATILIIVVRFSDKMEHSKMLSDKSSVFIQFTHENDPIHLIDAANSR